MHLQKRKLPTIIVACREGNISEAAELLKEEESLSVTDEKGNTALLVACEYGHLELVKMLLKSAADIYAANNSGFTALMLASSKNHVSIVTLLLEEGVSEQYVNQQNMLGNTALILAARINAVEILSLLIQYGAQVDIPGMWSNTALMHAMKENHYDAVICLLDAGANVNSQESYLSDTPLILAARNNQLRFVELFLEYGADLELCDMHGRTALMNAYYKGHTDIINYLNHYNSTEHPAYILK